MPPPHVGTVLQVFGNPDARVTDILSIESLLMYSNVWAVELAERRKMEGVLGPDSQNVFVVDLVGNTTSTPESATVFSGTDVVTNMDVATMRFLLSQVVVPTSAAVNMAVQCRRQGLQGSRTILLAYIPSGEEGVAKAAIASNHATERRVVRDVVRGIVADGVATSNELMTHWPARWSGYWKVSRLWKKGGEGDAE